MPDIVHQLSIHAPPARVFPAVSTPAGLDAWWTKRSAGEAREGAEFTLWFGPEYDWRARVTACRAPAAFELELVQAHQDWLGTRVGFELAEQAGGTEVTFHHAGWPRANEHWRVSCYCWAMYLRILRRHLEHGKVVPYERRLVV